MDEVHCEFCEYYDPNDNRCTYLDCSLLEDCTELLPCERAEEDLQV